MIDETGVLKGKVRRALDSTVLDDAVATQDTVTQLIAAIRRVRRLVPQAAALELGGHDYSDPGKPRIAWDDDEARQQLITGLVNDALAVLDAVDGVELDRPSSRRGRVVGAGRRPRRRTRRQRRDRGGSPSAPRRTG